MDRIISNHACGLSTRASGEQLQEYKGHVNKVCFWVGLKFVLGFVVVDFGSTQSLLQSPAV